MLSDNKPTQYSFLSTLVISLDIRKKSIGYTEENLNNANINRRPQLKMVN